MFVVHTVNQLEEAVRVGAEEILITGCLVSNVHEAYALKSCKAQGERGTDSTEEQEVCDIDRVAAKAKVPVWGISSLMMITNDYSLMNSHLDAHSPRMFLQRMNQH